MNRAVLTVLDDGAFDAGTKHDDGVLAVCDPHVRDYTEHPDLAGLNTLETDGHEVHHRHGGLVFDVLDKDVAAVTDVELGRRESGADKTQWVVAHAHRVPPLLQTDLGRHAVGHEREHGVSRRIAQVAAEPHGGQSWQREVVRTERVVARSVLIVGSVDGVGMEHECAVVTVSEDDVTCGHRDLTTSHVLDNGDVARTEQKHGLSRITQTDRTHRVHDDDGALGLELLAHNITERVSLATCLLAERDAPRQEEVLAGAHVCNVVHGTVAVAVHSVTQQRAVALKPKAGGLLLLQGQAVGCV
eukprot:PhM_4_TR19104/c2_g1_i1/m.28041